MREEPLEKEVSVGFQDSQGHQAIQDHRVSQAQMDKQAKRVHLENQALPDQRDRRVNLDLQGREDTPERKAGLECLGGLGRAVPWAPLDHVDLQGSEDSLAYQVLQETPVPLDCLGQWQML